MDKQTLSEAISNAKKYAKNLKVKSTQFSNKYKPTILYLNHKIPSHVN